MDEQPGTIKITPARLLLFAGVFTGVVILGHNLHYGEAVQATIWIAKGVLIAMLVATRFRDWPAILIIAEAISFSVWMVMSGLGIDAQSIGAAIFVRILDVSVALTAAWLCRGMLELRDPLRRPRSLVLFLLVPCALLSGVNAAGGGLSLGVFLSHDTFIDTLREWWLSDALGVAMVCPLLLGVLSGRSLTPTMTPARWLEFIIALTATLLVGQFALGGESVGARSVHEYPFILLPGLIWILLRFDARLLAATLLLVVILTAANLVTGHGPYISLGQTRADVLTMQAEMAMLAISLLILAAAENDRADSARRRLQAEAHLAERRRFEMLGAMAAGVAHDMGNLAFAITGYQTALRSSVYERDENAQSALDGLASVCEHARATVRSLTAVAGSDPDRLAPVNMSKAARTALRIATETTPDGVRIDTELAEDTLIVHGDEAQLIQALRNILENAIQAARSHVALRIERVNPGRVRITVTNDGPGIPPDIIDRIFDPFFSTKSRDHGTGLGLAIVAAVIRSHDGEITVDNPDTGGARIVISIPVTATTEP